MAFDARDKHRGLVQASDFSRIVGIIDTVSDIKTDRTQINGTLAAIDTIGGGGFKFVPATIGGLDVIAGALAKDFDRSQQWSVNTGYMADVGFETITKFATEETRVTYRLHRLQILK